MRRSRSRPGKDLALATSMLAKDRGAVVRGPDTFSRGQRALPFLEDTCLHAPVAFSSIMGCPAT